ncbi:hypothetical protein [Pseudomonas phage PMBT14]|uniref:Uncharacterized protein n=1 Tax=Pseudomonas phage PMBT14 TaxID=2059855 RepID=A0A2I6PI95_9CAUD|nr:hypothetical protein HWB42_gp62 [Pseudomonas phage PMBT14]AUM59780.1 hypothetical protein [Pseudomonas phage PMBT14]
MIKVMQARAILRIIKEYENRLDHGQSYGVEGDAALAQLKMYSLQEPGECQLPKPFNLVCSLPDGHAGNCSVKVPV